MFDISGRWRRIPLGAPSRYAILTVIVSLFWFPVRLWVLDRGDPLPEVVAGAAFSGAIWALFPWLNRLSRPREQRPADAADALGPAEIRTRARRGAVAGMGLGLVYFGGLIAMSVLTLPQRRLYVATFAVILLLMGVAAVVSLRSARSRAAGSERA